MFRWLELNKSQSASSILGQNPGVWIILSDLIWTTEYLAAQDNSSFCTKHHASVSFICSGATQ